MADKTTRKKTQMETQTKLGERHSKHERKMKTALYNSTPLGRRGLCD
jgi:hypothetical protein